MWAVLVHDNLLRWPNRVGRMLLLSRKSVPGFTSQLGWVACGTCPSFSHNNNHWSSRLKSSICWWTCYINLLGPYLQLATSTFNTCLQGPTHHSLTDTCRGYNLGGVSFPHHPPRPSQPMIIRFPLRASPDLMLTIQPFTTEPKWSNPNLTSGTPPLDFYHSLSSKHSSD
jgi:hypothetical protein